MDNIKKNFCFDKPFLDMFGEMNDAMDDCISEISKFDGGNYDYGVCASSYKMRIIKPENVTTFIDMLIKAINMQMINTVGDVDKFSVEFIKRTLEENGCSKCNCSEPFGYIENTSEWNSIVDCIIDLKNECFNRSCYGTFDLKQRKLYAMDDVETFKKMGFYKKMKSLVNGIPAIMKSAGICSKFTDVQNDYLRESIESFIMFAFSINIITLNEIKDYVIPKESYKSQMDPTGVKMVTECSLVKTPTVNLRTRIPFEINIRNIALADNTIGFRDVDRAVDYIVKNPESPINQLILRHIGSCECQRGCYDDIISRIFTYYGNYDKYCDTCNTECAPNSNCEWLDKICHGNAFIDGCYNRCKQVTGNAYQNNILPMLDALYKTYNGCGCGLKTNEEIANNIIKVYSAIKYTTSRANQVENNQIVRDVLCLLGEIITRDIVMLFNNNTRVFDFSDMCIADTMSPAYMYAESFESYNTDEFVMEADNNQQTEATVTMNNNNNKSNGNNTNNNNNSNKTVTAVWQKFMQWVRTVISSIDKKFNKDHKAEIEYVKKNKELYEKIYNELPTSDSDNDSKFRPNLNNFPEFKIKAEELTKFSILDEVKKILNRTDATKGGYITSNDSNGGNKKTLEASFYPGGEQLRAKIAEQRSDKEKAKILKNYILFSQETEPPRYTGVLTKEKWKEIYDDLTNSFVLVQQQTERFSQEITNATTEIDNKVKGISEGTTDPLQKAIREDAIEMQKDFPKLVSLFATTATNCLMKDFYGTTYNVYCSVIKAYKQQQSSNNTNNNTDNSVQKEQTTENNGVAP